MSVKPRQPRESPEQKVLRFFRDNSLAGSVSRLVVAVSGGADSVCLLHILYNLRNELRTDLHVAHLNHKLRGDESDGDARYVSGLAERLGLSCTIGEVDAAGYRRHHGGTLEEAAREVRYNFLAETAKAVGTDIVAAGHTADDNIETVLLHLVRGTGTRGLRGLSPVTAWKLPGETVRVIRPLLEFSREETAGYCEKNGLEPRLDSSNLSLSPLRNRIRQQLIPLLESYNERAGDALIRTAHAAADEMDFLDTAVSGLWGDVAGKEGNTVILDKAGFTGLHPALQRHLVRQAILDVRGSLKDIETRHMDAVLDALQMPAGNRIDLPDGLVFVIEYDRFLLTVRPAELSPLPPLEGEYPLKIPGDTVIPGWRVSAVVAGHDDAEDTNDGFTAQFDFNRTGDTLSVRPRKTADRFQPLGMDAEKKVGEFMIDVKIPRAWRDRVPVVCSPGQIVWLAGWRIDDRVKVTAGTKKVLKLAFVREQ
jgi:tRNA(Ile)-lysidine synthase